MNLEIREVRKEDIVEISRIYIDTVHSEYKRLIPWELLDAMDVEKEAQDFMEWINNGEKFHLIYAACIENHVVGFISVSSNTVEPFDYDSEINEFFVRKEYQNQGIGLKLLYTAICNLKENGYSTIIARNLSESNANNFYKRLCGKIVKQVEQYDRGIAIHVDIFGWKIDELINLIESGKK
jgi:predicted acetyltransferase